MLALLGLDSGVVLRIGASNVSIKTRLIAPDQLVVLKLGNNLFCGIFGF